MTPKMARPSTTIAPTTFGGSANSLESRVAAPAHAPKDATAGANAGSAANLFEQRVTQQN